MHVVTLAILALLMASDPAFAFDHTAWQDVRLAEMAEGTQLYIDPAPSGLLLRRRLEPEKRYRLTVRGSGRPITMRLQLDDRPHEYLPAPMAELTRTVTGASNIELLFYSDTPSEYLLSTAVIEECPTCRTQQDLMQRIKDEIPDFAKLVGLDKAVALLKWSANASSYTPNTGLIPVEFESWPPERMLYEFFDLDKGGVSCGGQSVFFRYVLHIFGIEAFTVNYGIPDTYVTHVTVIVPVDGDYYVLDPSFGVLFKRNGRSIGLDEALSLIKSNASGRIVVKNVGLERKGIISSPGTVHPALDRICVRRTATSDGLRKCTIGRNSVLQAFSRGASRDMWAAAGVPLTDDALLRLMFKGFFNVGPSLDPKVREAFVALVESHGISFHPN